MKVFPKAAAHLQSLCAQLGMWAGRPGGGGLDLQVCRAEPFHSIAETDITTGALNTRGPGRLHSRASCFDSLRIWMAGAWISHAMLQSCVMGKECSAGRRPALPSIHRHHFIWQWSVFGVLLITAEHRNSCLVLFPFFVSKKRLKTRWHWFVFFPLHVMEFIREQRPLWTVFTSLSRTPSEKSSFSHWHTFLLLLGFFFFGWVVRWNTPLEMCHLWCQGYHTDTQVGDNALFLPFTNADSPAKPQASGLAGGCKQFLCAKPYPKIRK